MEIWHKNGYIKFNVDVCEEDELVIDELQVFEKRKGTGTMLVNKVIDYARENKLNLVSICIHPLDNSISFEALKKFYKKIGFNIYQDDGYCAMADYAIK